MQARQPGVIPAFNTAVQRHSPETPLQVFTRSSPGSLRSPLCLPRKRPSTLPDPRRKGHTPPSAAGVTHLDPSSLNQRCPGQRNDRVGQQSRTTHCHTGLPMKASLLDPRAAALNQDNQNDDKQHTCDNLNNCGAIHLNPLSCKKFVRAFHLSTGNMPHLELTWRGSRPASCESA